MATANENLTLAQRELEGLNCQSLLNSSFVITNFPAFSHHKLSNRSFVFHICSTQSISSSRLNSFSQIVSMKQVAERDKRKGKAKVGEADDELVLPKTMSDIDDQCIVLKLEGDLRFEDVVGPKSLDNVTRMVFLVRYKDIPLFLGEEDETLKRIQMVSGATIGIVSGAEVRVHRQAHLELWGTVDQVKIAELLIVDAITEMYGKSFVPSALMPPTICRNEVYIPSLQAIHLLGMSDENIVKMEARSGAWVQADPVELPPSGKPWMRRIHVYGSDQQITKVMIMINKVVSVEPYISEEPESSKVEDENKQHHDSERSKEAKSEK